LAFSLALLVGACSHPYVKHSSILGTVRTVPHWTVGWDEPDRQNRQLTQVVAGLDNKSRYSLEEYCHRFVNDVKISLSSDYGITVAQNYANQGRINVRIFGATLSKYLPPDTLGTDYQHQKAMNTSDGTAFNTDMLVTSADVLFGGTDHVNRVELGLFDTEGKEAGSAEIKGDNVSPKFVAKVIHKLITTGSYNKSGFKASVGGKK